MKSPLSTHTHTHTRMQARTRARSHTHTQAPNTQVTHTHRGAHFSEQESPRITSVFAQVTAPVPARRYDSNRSWNSTTDFLAVRFGSHLDLRLDLVYRPSPPDNGHPPPSHSRSLPTPCGLAGRPHASPPSVHTPFTNIGLRGFAQVMVTEVTS